MIVATTNFSFQKTSADDYWRRVRHFTQRASDQGADLVLFPEYASLPWLFSAGGGFQERLSAAASQEPLYVEEARRASAEFRIAVVAGSYPHVEGGKIVNRAWIFRPGQDPVFQDKLNPTRTEAEEWGAASGPPELRLFRHGGALCAVAICYDVEFPAYCRAAAAAQVEVLLVPSCTSDVHGHWRVRHCSAARAVENQCFVVTSAAVEGDRRYPEIGAHYGRAAVLSPCDLGFPEGGVVAEALPNAEDLVTARIELRALQEIRRGGTVLNLRNAQAHPTVSWKE